MPRGRRISAAGPRRPCSLRRPGAQALSALNKPQADPRPARGHEPWLAGFGNHLGQIFQRPPLTSGDGTNRAYVGEDIELGDAVDENLRKLFFDPQTAGGMLIAVPSDRAQALLMRLRAHYPQASIVGVVVERGPRLITVN